MEIRKYAKLCMKKTFIYYFRRYGIIRRCGVHYGTGTFSIITSSPTRKKCSREQVIFTLRKKKTRLVIKSHETPRANLEVLCTQRKKKTRTGNRNKLITFSLFVKKKFRPIFDIVIQQLSYSWRMI